MALTYPLVNLSTRAAVATKKEDLSLKEALLKTIKEEGLSGLYSGLESSLVGIAITNGIYYVSAATGAPLAICALTFSSSTKRRARSSSPAVPRHPLRLRRSPQVKVSLLA